MNRAGDSLDTLAIAWFSDSLVGQKLPPGTVGFGINWSKTFARCAISSCATPTNKAEVLVLVIKFKVSFLLFTHLHF